MSDAWDWCCDRCGGAAVRHFLGPDVRGRKRWQNRCQGCGRVSEYLPTRAEIEDECRRLRAAANQVGLNDAQEKVWRRMNEVAQNDGEGEDPE